MSEFNSHLTDEDRQHKVVSKAIGEYIYTIINNDYGDYTVIGKHPITPRFNDEWEDLK